MKLTVFLIQQESVLAVFKGHNYVIVFSLKSEANKKVVFVLELVYKVVNNLKLVLVYSSSSCILYLMLVHMLSKPICS